MESTELNSTEINKEIIEGKIGVYNSILSSSNKVLNIKKHCD